MNLDFEKWFKEILALQVEFNSSKDYVRKFAILTTLYVEFQKHADWLKEESEGRYRTLAVDSILKRK